MSITINYFLKFLPEITILKNKFDPSNRIFQLECDISCLKFLIITNE
jgi:hypothetical protein